MNFPKAFQTKAAIVPKIRYRLLNSISFLTIHSLIFLFKVSFNNSDYVTSKCLINNEQFIAHYVEKSGRHLI
jgi:hypothetical protein